MSAAVPEALSFSPPSGPLLSRCAMTMISGGERPVPGFSVTRLTSVVRRPLIVAVNGWRRTSKPYGFNWPRNQAAAALAPGVPGRRSG